MSEEKTTPRHVGGPFDGDVVPPEHNNCLDSVVYAEGEYQRGADGNFYHVDATHEPRMYHQAILRLSYELLADLIGLPSGTRIVATSEHDSFVTNQLALKIEDERLRKTPESCPIPRIQSSFHKGDVSMRQTWDGPDTMGGYTQPVEPRILPDAKKLTALLSRLNDHLGSFIDRDAAEKPWDSELAITALGLREEIAAAIGELQGNVAIAQKSFTEIELAARPLYLHAAWSPILYDAPALAAVSDTPGAHGGFVGVCGVEDCSHCKPQQPADEPPKDAEPERKQTWRDQPSML